MYSKGKELIAIDIIIKVLTIIWLILQIACKLVDIIEDDDKHQ
jgi:hypothetical protein